MTFILGNRGEMIMKESKIFKPLVDKLFWIILIPTATLMLGVTVLAVFEPTALSIIIPADIFVGYFLISPLFGYVELKENTLFIKYGFILKKEISYSKIRSLEKDRKWYSEAMMSLKNSMEHIIIKYNKFDVTIVSVVDNDTFIAEVSKRINNI